MAKVRTRQRKLPLDVVEPKKVVEKPLHLSTDYTGRLRMIGTILDSILTRNLRKNGDLSLGGYISEEEIRQIYLLTKVRRVNGSKKRSRDIQG